MAGLVGGLMLVRGGNHIYYAMSFYDLYSFLKVRETRAAPSTFEIDFSPI